MKLQKIIDTMTTFRIDSQPNVLAALRIAQDEDKVRGEVGEENIKLIICAILMDRMAA